MLQAKNRHHLDVSLSKAANFQDSCINYVGYVKKPLYGNVKGHQEMSCDKFLRNVFLDDQCIFI